MGGVSLGDLILEADVTNCKQGQKAEKTHTQPMLELD